MLVGCYRRILRGIIELSRERGGRRIFPLPAYRPPDRFLNRYRFRVPQFVADARRTRRPMLRGVAGLSQVARRALLRQDDEPPFPPHLAGYFPRPLQFAKRRFLAHIVDTSRCAIIGGD